MDDLVIDSSVFVAAFKENDPFHEQALQTMGQIGVKYRALVSCLVPVEVVGVATRAIGSKHAERIRKKFIDWAESGFLSYIFGIFRIYRLIFPRRGFFPFPLDLAMISSTNLTASKHTSSLILKPTLDQLLEGLQNARKNFRIVTSTI